MTGDFGSKAYGIDGKVGINMDKWLPYIKLGIGRIKGTEDADGYSKNGPHLGIGAEYKFAPNWSFSGELSRIAGKEDGGIKLTNNSLLFGLKYYFGGKPAAVAAPVAAVAAAAPVAPPPKPAPRKEKYTCPPASCSPSTAPS